LTHERATWNPVLQPQCDVAAADLAWWFWTDLGKWVVVDPAISHVRIDPWFEVGPEAPP
jgi:hypothetical protein